VSDNPVPLQYSNLGNFLKNIHSHSLAVNRWAPLLPREKEVLHEVAGPIGILAIESDHKWDWENRYECADYDRQGESSLKAVREKSYRWWGASVQQHDFKIMLPFELPYRGRRIESFTIGQDGQFQNVVSHHFDESTPLVEGTLVQTIDYLPETFTVSVEITPTGGTVGTPLNMFWGPWGGILRLTTTNGWCCKPGDVVLGVWFDPGTLQLTFGLGQTGGKALAMGG
jgi:hypothetical protein